MADESLISIADVPRKLASAGYQPPAYRHVWSALVDSKFDGERVGGRWFVRPDTLDSIAAALNLPKAA